MIAGSLSSSTAGFRRSCRSSRSSGPRRSFVGIGPRRRGLSLLWGPEALGEIAKPPEVASIRDLFSFSRKWPVDLPSNAGQTLIVAGVEGTGRLWSRTSPPWFEDQSPWHHSPQHAQPSIVLGMRFRSERWQR